MYGMFRRSCLQSLKGGEMKKETMIDLFGIVGLLLVGGGTWFVYPPASAIVVGSLLLIVAAVGILR